MTTAAASKLALGTAQFGLRYGISNKTGQVPRSEIKSMLQLALDNHMDTIDTAIAYGESETCLGDVGTAGFKIVTKLPAVPDDCADVGVWIRNQFRSSLSKLGVTSAYGVLLHRPDQLLGPNGVVLYKSLLSLKETGKVQKVGVSIYSPNELADLSSKYRFDLVQAPFNLVDRRMHSTGWLQRLKNSGVELHTRSTFLQGLLLLSQNERPAKFAPWRELWNKWSRWLEHSCYSPVEACLAFPLSFPEIDRVLVGADSHEHLAQIIKAANNHSITMLPDLQCTDEDLINPGNWSKL